MQVVELKYTQPKKYSQKKKTKKKRRKSALTVAIFFFSLIHLFCTSGVGHQLVVLGLAVIVITILSSLYDE
jgi:hypothetical protein